VARFKHGTGNMVREAHFIFDYQNSHAVSKRVALCGTRGSVKETDRVHQVRAQRQTRRRFDFQCVAIRVGCSNAVNEMSFAKVSYARVRAQVTIVLRLAA
jgi:hypothetical protein